jgi:hypothetical protein
MILKPLSFLLFFEFLLVPVDPVRDLIEYRVDRVPVSRRRSLGSCLSQILGAVCADDALLGTLVAHDRKPDIHWYEFYCMNERNCPERSIRNGSAVGCSIGKGAHAT